MSSNKALIISVFSIWAIIGGYYLWPQAHNHSNHNHSHSGMTAKLSAGVNVEFEMTSQEPAPNENIEVIAKITSLTDSGDYDYQIFMPGNSELISPSIEGPIALYEGEAQELVLVFKQSVNYDMKIHLELRKPGSPNASMFTFSTLDFHGNQAEVEALQERQAEYGGK